MTEPALREYHIILKRYDDLDEFYYDMEHEGGNLYIPNRCVECSDRVPGSRVTKYMLTDEEAELVAKDPRVEAVELNFEDSGIIPAPMSAAPIQSGTQWDKSDIVNSTMLNWGLVRCTQDRPTPTINYEYPNGICLSSELSHYNNKPVGFKVLLYDELKLVTKIGTGNNWSESPGYWEIPDLTQIPSGNVWGLYGANPADPADTGYYKTAIDAVVQLNATGKNVDVVILDGGIVNPSHPEFQRNPDGTGGSRVIQYNWFQHNQELGIGSNGNYSYDLSRVDSHATHVTGTVAGITQGWAKEANIYNIDFYNNNALRYILAFHRNKPINPLTGRRNPTICNNSWGNFVPGGGKFFDINSSSTVSRISQVVYNGTVYNKPATGNFTKQQLFQWKLYPFTSSGYVNSPTIATLYKELMNGGVVCVAAAGNSAFNAVKKTHPSYENTITLTGTAPSGFTPAGTYKYMQGPSPGASDDEEQRLMIGALDVTPWDWKTNFSTTGEVVDLHAPGYNIMSSYINEPNIRNAVTDSRNNSFFLQKLQGTSMATPQVCGIIACLAEHYPHWTNKEFKEYLIGTAETGSIAESTFTVGLSNSDYFLLHHLQDSPNRIVRFRRQRPIDGVTWPRTTHGLRKNGTYPRLKPGRK